MHFHGCGMGRWDVIDLEIDLTINQATKSWFRFFIDDNYIRNSGMMETADLYDVILLLPQVFSPSSAIIHTLGRSLATRCSKIQLISVLGSASLLDWEHCWVLGLLGISIRGRSHLWYVIIVYASPPLIWSHTMHIFALYLSFTALIFQQQRLVFKWVESLKCFEGSLASKFEKALIVSSQFWRKKTLEMFQAWIQISQQEALKFKHLLWN